MVALRMTSLFPHEGCCQLLRIRMVPGAASFPMIQSPRMTQGALSFRRVKMAVTVICSFLFRMMVPVIVSEGRSSMGGEAIVRSVRLDQNWR